MTAEKTTSKTRSTKTHSATLVSQVWMLMGLYLVSVFAAPSQATWYNPPADYCDEQYIWLEAECGDICPPGEVKYDHDASEDYYLYSPPGSGRPLYHPGSKLATYHFNVAYDCHDCYYIWARVKYDSYEHNSCWLKFDHYSDMEWRYDDSKTHAWHWERIKIGSLQKGAHQLVLKLREEQTKIDKFLITSDAHYSPYGYGEEAENKCPTEPQCPDLIITGIKVTPQYPEVGDVLSVEVTVKNQGNTDAGSFDVDWYKNRTSKPGLGLAGTGSRSLSLAAGESNTLYFNWTCLRPGCFKIYAQADTYNDVYECDETNNCYGPVEICVREPLPVCDKEYHWLEAECGEICWPGEVREAHDASKQHYLTTPAYSGSSLYYAGNKIATYHFNIDTDCYEEYQLWARVKYDSHQHNSFWFKMNQGTPRQWRFDDHKLNQWHWESISLGRLAQGSQLLTLMVREEQTHVDKFLITNDAQYRPQHYGEEAENLCCPQGCCADLIVTDISWTPANPVAGQSVTVKVTVENKGTLDANHFRVDWYKNRATRPGQGVLGDRHEVISLGAGQQYTLYITYTCVQAGCYDMYAQVDTDNVIDECNEHNNVYGPKRICVDAYETCYPEFHWLEAEGGEIYSPGQIDYDHGASRNYYLTTPAHSGRLLDQCGPKIASYGFEIENKCHDCYYLWVRVKYDSYLHNSFWVQLDHYDNVAWRFDDSKTHQWHWERIKMGQLSKGHHTLKLKLREEQTKVDKFLITSDGNYKPYGHGDEAENCPVWYP